MHKEDKNAHSIENTVKEAISHSSDNIKEITAQLVEELSDYLKNKQGDIAGMKGKCKHHIKENPFTTVIGALAIGTLIGLLLKK